MRMRHSPGTYADAFAVGRAHWRARPVFAPHAIVRPGEGVAVRIDNRHNDVVFVVQRRSLLLVAAAAAAAATIRDQLIDYIEQR